MPHFMHDGVTFHYRSSGAGRPFLFQHGLGGDSTQTFDLFQPPAGVRLITLDCRGHGETWPLGDPTALTFATFADDVQALMEHLSVGQAAVGGISMGAGVALNLALRFPERVRALVLVRPAWLDGPMPANLLLFPAVAALIRRYGAAEAERHFERSDLFEDLQRRSPDNARALLGQFSRPRAEETVAKLERLPADAPDLDRRTWGGIAAPTLVLVCRQDPAHPFEFGAALAAAVPGAQVHEVTAKDVDVDAYRRDVQERIVRFLEGVTPA